MSGNILTIVDPDLVVIGGGLSNFTAITAQLADRLPRHLLPVARVPRIERARHGDAGGMRGAAPTSYRLIQRGCYAVASGSSVKPFS